MPIRCATPSTSGGDFERLLRVNGAADLDAVTASFLGELPPQQRSTLLLVYGEGFGHEDAGLVLDTGPDTIQARLIRACASLADRFGASPRPASVAVETLYPLEATEAP